MRTLVSLLICLAAPFAWGDTLPIITTQPTNQNVSIGGTATFSIAATGATSFQWRYNGADIPDATNATLQVSNVQTNNTGYYLAVAKNGIGWVPSGMAYLSAGGPISGGLVSFANAGAYYSVNTVLYSNPPLYPGPITNGMARIVAGPALDQMQPIGYSTPMTNGYFQGSDQVVPTVVPGQPVYYRVNITFPVNGGSFTQSSTTIKLIAGDGAAYPVPASIGLQFPVWIEWPGDPHLISATPTNQIRLPGETVSFTNDFYADSDYGLPVGQWRKDGKLLPNRTNFFQYDGSSGYGDFRTVLTLTNVQPGDAGVYDVQVLGDNWIVAAKTILSVQTSNGQGVFQSPRSDGTQFVTDFQGIAGRNYGILWSSNLLNWNTLLTLSSGTGFVTFTNSSTDHARYYRAVLLP